MVCNYLESCSQFKPKSIKVPHVGFNLINHDKHKIWKGIPEQASIYFVHSYKIVNQTNLPYVAICNYGGDFVAAFQSGNIYGTQFHPEKSQSNGLQLIANFLS